MPRYYSQQYSAVDAPAPSGAIHELERYGDAQNPFTSYSDPHPPSNHGSSTPALPSPGYAYGGAAANIDPFEDQNSLKAPRKAGWSRKRKIIIFGGIAAVLVIAIAVGVGVGVALSSKGSPYDYTPSTAQVTNDTAFSEGGASKSDPWTTTSDGIGAGEDKYTYYSGTSENFPALSSWVSFDDMWAGNVYTIQNSCKNLKAGKNNSPEDTQNIYDAIQNRSAASYVDHRFILAVILQESHGCVHIGSTTSSSGVNNPGLMQSHDGHAYSSKHANESILAMVQDGTQGTSAGDGLVQNLNMYGNAYRAARGYNSGYIPTSGNLSEAAGATPCYVSDIANRLTGWANATNTCTGGY